MFHHHKVTLTANEIAQALTRMNSPALAPLTQINASSQKHLAAAASWVVNRRKENSSRLFSTAVHGSPI
ncbi:hypothetical protein IM40_05780 [Candidatus Paracaedimonas acanthamoebae]|nr:hypothetical protein IM40_05780 [Candidatus Paracaedimonas acanthamoebae]